MDYILNIVKTLLYKKRDINFRFLLKNISNAIYNENLC